MPLLGTSLTADGGLCLLNVEPDAIRGLLPDVPLFGMFCHGELGPTNAIGFTPQGASDTPCRTHSMTTIAAIYASKRSTS